MTTITYTIEGQRGAKHRLIFAREHGGGMLIRVQRHIQSAKYGPTWRDVGGASIETNDTSARVLAGMLMTPMPEPVE